MTPLRLLAAQIAVIPLALVLILIAHITGDDAGDQP